MKRKSTRTESDSDQPENANSPSLPTAAAGPIEARQLTAAQRAAVEHLDGPLLILAGPGSGKTHVVTQRVVNLLRQGVADHQILALTFTNKAADEMKQRLRALVPEARVWVGTFHSFCAGLLRRHANLVGLAENFSIYDVDDSRRLLSEAVVEAQVNLSHVSLDRIAQEIGQAKNHLVLPGEYQARPGGTLGGLVEQIYPVYQRRLLQANAVDFDDLLLHTGTLLRENPVLRSKLDARHRYILVDEYQDTNFVQYAIVRALSRDYPNLAVTGDPDQSIYGWRGASVENIFEFERDYPQVRVVKLEQNYRSTQRILRVADQLILHNTRRKHKTLLTDNPEGKPVRLTIFPTSQDEAEQIVQQIAGDLRERKRQPRDFAIFYRTNTLSRGIETAMRQAGVPYQIIRGVEFYNRKEVKDLLAYLHLINNPSNDIAFLRIINAPPRRIGKTTLARISDYARRQRLPLLAAARAADRVEGLNRPTRQAVAAFVELQDRWSKLASRPVEEILGYVMAETAYENWLQQTDPEQERLANVKELLTDAREFDAAHPDPNPLERFLEQAALVNDVDALEIETDKVSLMTLHAAKGLEFPVVFIVGVEQGLIPHERNLEDPQRLEEERRLLFVGMTRAKEELTLTTASYRHLQGSRRMTVPSQFLMEVPREEMIFEEPPSLGWGSADPYAREAAQYDDDASYYEGTDEESEANDAQDDFFPDDSPGEFWDEGPGSGKTARRAAKSSDRRSVRPGRTGAAPSSTRGSAAPDAASPAARRTPASTSSAAPVETSVPRVLTAAQLLGTSSATEANPTPAAPLAARVPVEQFTQGMLVTHPERGTGKILAISGEGTKRAATVQFFHETSPTRFILAFSPLRPLSSE
jgi:DNA helicase-2/ATP-dependent DNA helicase PcrA